MEACLIMNDASSPDLKYLGVIIARGGSKGIPLKNIHPCAGRPLLAYTCDAATASQRLSRVILSTDSPQIAEVGRANGVAVPFMRPAELAKDDVGSIPVIRHALDFLAAEEGYVPDIVVTLPPTAPLRRAIHIDEAIDLLVKENSDSVVSVAPVPGHYNPHWQFRIVEGQLTIFTGESLTEIVPRRQRLATTYTRNGALYVFWRRTLEKYGNQYGRDCLPYIMLPEESVNIDTMEDLVLAEIYLRGVPQHKFV